MRKISLRNSVHPLVHTYTVKGRKLTFKCSTKKLKLVKNLPVRQIGIYQTITVLHSKKP